MISNQNFTLTKGDSFTIGIEAMKQDKTPLTPASASWEIRESEKGEIVFSKSDLTISGSTVYIELQPEETDTFEQSSYLHWVRIIDQDGKKSTITKGTMKVER